MIVISFVTLLTMKCRCLMSRKPLTIKEESTNYIFKVEVTTVKNAYINKQSSTLQKSPVLYNVNKYKQ